MIRVEQRADRLGRSLFTATSVVAILTFAPVSSSAIATTTDAPVADTTGDPGTSIPDTSIPTDVGNDFLDLERSLAECISSNPPPGCGREPTGPGDRGGWQQLVLFAVMMGGISVIFWRVSKSVRARDASMSTDTSKLTDE